MVENAPKKNYIMSLAISDILRVTCIVRVFTGKKDCRQTNDHA